MPILESVLTSLGTRLFTDAVLRPPRYPDILHKSIYVIGIVTVAIVLFRIATEFERSNAAPSPSSSPAVKNEAYHPHDVEQGESLYRITNGNRACMDQIHEKNRDLIGDDENYLQAGWTIYIPDGCARYAEAETATPADHSEAPDASQSASGEDTSEHDNLADNQTDPQQIASLQSSVHEPEPAATPASNALQSDATAQVRPQLSVTYQVQPQYPCYAKDPQRTGTITYYAKVMPNGAVREMRYVRGDLVFSESARRAIGQWRYQPFEATSEYPFIWEPITIDCRDLSPQQ